VIPCLPPCTPVDCSPVTAVQWRTTGLRNLHSSRQAGHVRVRGRPGEFVPSILLYLLSVGLQTFTLALLKRTRELEERLAAVTGRTCVAEHPPGLDTSNEVERALGALC
jgi:hypothetical protein